MSEQTDMKSNVHFRHCGVPCCGVCKWFDKPYEYAFCHCKDADMTARLSVKEDMVCDKWEPAHKMWNIWMEGYQLNGDIGFPRCVASCVEAETFKDAVLKYDATRSEYDRKKYPLEWNGDRPSIWGCLLFPRDEWR